MSLTPAGASRSHASPLSPLLKADGPIVRCIMWRESRSTPEHLNLRDNRTYGSSGIFQFEDSTFMAYSPWKVHVWQATPYQQEVVFALVVHRDGFSPWTRYDGC